VLSSSALRASSEPQPNSSLPKGESEVFKNVVFSFYSKIKEKQVSKTPVFLVIPFLPKAETGSPTVDDLAIVKEIIPKKKAKINPTP